MPLNQPQTQIQTVTQTVLDFLEQINRHDLEGVAELLAEDHVFTDSVGNIVAGREKMLAAWRAYFAFCPDYWITHEEILLQGDKVAIFGAAGGTIASGGQLPEENRWRISAAWFAQVRDGRLTQWRIFADNKPVYDILARTKPA